ncbi:MAG: Ribosomal protein methyltransferase [Bacteroidota bacterium]|jgi:ribosomal protein L11 methyltransferase
MENLEIKFICSDELTDMLIAEISLIGFDIFEQNNDGFVTFHSDVNFDLTEIDEIISRYRPLGEIHYSTEIIKKVNWNKEWESNYSPIEVNDKVYIRASFHPPKEGFETEILINPQMSFGTGHHETTRLVIGLMMEENWVEQEVMDAGTGTGILAIYAKIKGAKKVVGFDIDDWCIENSIENAELNNISGYSFNQGTIRDQSPYSYDALIANINRNILLDEMEEYAKFIKKGGALYLSGFYLEDSQVIHEKAEEYGLTYKTHASLNRWCAMKFIRN